MSERDWEDERRKRGKKEKPEKENMIDSQYPMNSDFAGFLSIEGAHEQLSQFIFQPPLTPG